MIIHWILFLFSQSMSLLNMLEKLLNLSNIANVLPYYGHYGKNKELVDELKPTLLPQFKLILGWWLFTDEHYNDLFLAKYKGLYYYLAEKYPNLMIDFGEPNSWRMNSSNLNVYKRLTNEPIFECE